MPSATRALLKRDEHHADDGGGEPNDLCQAIGSPRNNTPSSDPPTMNMPSIGTTTLAGLSARTDAEGWRTCKPICLISLAFVKGLAATALCRRTLSAAAAAIALVWIILS